MSAKLEVRSDGEQWYVIAEGVAYSFGDGDMGRRYCLGAVDGNTVETIRDYVPEPKFPKNLGPDILSLMCEPAVPRRPDAVGPWADRDGGIAVVYDHGSDLMADVCSAGEFSSFNVPVESLGHDEWLPYVAPEFPERAPDAPPKPVSCYVEINPSYGDVPPAWITFEPGSKHYYRRDPRGGPPCWGDLDEVDVIPHPDNDPEAVRLIESAKQGTL